MQSSSDLLMFSSQLLHPQSDNITLVAGPGQRLRTDRVRAFVRGKTPSSQRNPDDAHLYGRWYGAANRRAFDSS